MFSIPIYPEDCMGRDFDVLRKARRSRHTNLGGLSLSKVNLYILQFTAGIIS